MPSRKKKQLKRPFSLLIKPASADCNLNCRYCFYLEKGSMYPETAVHRMDYETLETLVSSYMLTSQPVYGFGWQGGEPALMGTGFFRKVTELQERYGRPGSRVANALQTNGTLLDDELAEHLKQYRFLVGISIDGPEDMHDRYRTGRNGDGTYRRVLSGIETLKKHSVEFNALVLVTKANVQSPEKVYAHLKELGIHYHQYIPCVDAGTGGRSLPWSISGEEWGDFLIRIFSQWRLRDTERISIRNFDAVLQYLINGRTVMCSMGRNCSEYCVIEYNGDVYPCDFFVEPELRLGTMREDDLGALRASPLYRRFAGRKTEWIRECASCDFVPLCAGDCLKHRRGIGLPGVNASGSGQQEVSVLCPGWKKFYSSCLPAFRKIAERIGNPRT